MILVLSAIAVGGGLLLGRWVAARQAKTLPAAEPKVAPSAGPDATAPVEDPRASASSVPVEAAERAEIGEPMAKVDWSAFPCALGDVVMRPRDGAEAWLAGAIVFREDAPAAVLFIAPDAAGERAIYARPRPHAELVWLEPVPGGTIVVGAEPPSALEIDGRRFERQRRLPLRAERLGTGTPEVVGTALVGEYAAAGGQVALVIVADGVGRAWRGEELRDGDYEVWSGEKARERDERDERDERE